MITTDFSGTGVAIITPFDKNKNIDYNSLEKLLGHIIDGKVEYIVVLGTTGESVTLSKSEKQELLSFIAEKTANKIPIVLGIGSYNTNEVIDCIETTDLTSVSGILSVSPYYNKPTQEGIYQHFKTIAEATDKPIILYNVPGRTGSNISAKTTLRLANDFKNIVAIKEASGNFCQIMEIIKNKPGGFQVLSGDDALTFNLIALGGDGVISVIANSHPFEFSEMVRQLKAGNLSEAQKLHYQLLDYIGLLFEEGSPAGIKSALCEMGFITNVLRLPLVPASDGLAVRIKDMLKTI